MNKALLGIDLGTSSVKALLYHPNGKRELARAAYEEISPRGWLAAMEKALKQLDLQDTGAISLSAQTGTYVVDDTHVIPWSDPAGKEELPLIRSRFSQETFLAEIGMPHPAITSYPLPRLLYIKQKFGAVQSICQPKDLLLYALTGHRRSDVWTWRGLAHPEKGYSQRLLHDLGISADTLPPLGKATDVAGRVTSSAAVRYGLPEGTPVVCGLNDFFAGLVGMGVPALSPLFDITGTSEHFGVIEKTFTPQTGMVSGRFLQDFVHYGGTASSGPSMAFAMRELSVEQGPLATYLEKDPPIFLPYLNGERAPIFDPFARGVFFGLNRNCARAQMAYAVSEGVAFSIYHIAKHLGRLPTGEILLGGGAAKDPLLGQIKATLFDRPFITLEESDTSALGAAMVAGLGIGEFGDMAEATAACVRKKAVYTPIPALREKLLRRFEIYEDLYTALKPQFEKFKEI